MGVDEVDGEDEEDGEQAFFAVDDEDGIERPAGQEVRKEGREPHGVSGEADDHHAPENGPVVEFLPVGVALELRLGTEAEEPAEVAEEVLHVFPVGDHGGGSPEDSLFAFEKAARQDLTQVDEEGQSEDQGAEFVKEEDGAESADLPREADGPDGTAEAHHEAGGREHQKSGEQHRVEVALREREAQEIARLLRRLRRAAGMTDFGGSGGGRVSASDQAFFPPDDLAFACWKRDRTSHSTVCSRKNVSTLASNRFMNSRM